MSVNEPWYSRTGAGPGCVEWYGEPGALYGRSMPPGEASVSSSAPPSSALESDKGKRFPEVLTRDALRDACLREAVVLLNTGKRYLSSSTLWL